MSKAWRFLTRSDKPTEVTKSVADVERAYLDYIAERLAELGFEPAEYVPTQYSLSRLGSTNSGAVLWCVYGCCSYDYDYDEAGYALARILDGSVYILDADSAEVVLMKSKDGSELEAREDIADAFTNDPATLAEETEKALLKWADGRAAKPGYSVVKSDAAKRYTLGVAYPADEVDAHGEYTDASELETTAWEFMRDVVAKGASGVGTDHEDGTEGAADIVESYIYRGPDWVADDGETVIAKSGDWMVGAIWTEDQWERVTNGELTGWSIQGWAQHDPDAELPDADAE